MVCTGLLTLALPPPSLSCGLRFLSEESPRPCRLGECKCSTVVAVGFVKTAKCAILSTRMQPPRRPRFWIESQVRSETTATTRGDQLNGQTRSSLTTALAPSEMPAPISRLTIALSDS